MAEVKVDRELLLKVAKNARLNLTEAEIKVLLPQFEEMLKTFQKVSKVDVTGVSPAFHAIEIKNVFREDKVKSSPDKEALLKNSLFKKNNYIKGPKVVT